MNTQIQKWFSDGKAVEALCGFDGYFMSDVTYNNEHDFILVIGELLDWAKEGNRQSAADALLIAINKLLNLRRLRDALRLLRSYFILQRQSRIALPLDESVLISSFAQASGAAAEQLSRDEALRNLLFLVIQDIPKLNFAIGITRK